MKIDLDEIVSVSELVKNFTSIRERTKINRRTFIFKNNKPELVMLEFSEYERLHKIAESLVLTENTIEENKINNMENKKFKMI